MAHKITPIPQTEKKWHGLERPDPPSLSKAADQFVPQYQFDPPDKQLSIEQALNDGVINADEAERLAELGRDEIATYISAARSRVQKEDEKSKPIASFVAGHNMSLDEAVNTFEIQHLMWNLSHRVMQVRDTHKRMTEYGREVYDHAHRIGSIDGPRPMPTYSPDAIGEYNRACSEYRITADIVNSALSHFGVGEEDRKTLIERAVTSGLLKYR